MRNRVIPAQITTVEDTIAGNLTLNQVLILLAPVVLSSIIFILLPPVMTFVWYKLAISIVLLLICSILAIRVKERIILGWLVVIGTYFKRPNYYLFSKTDTHYRPQYPITNTLISDISEADVVETSHETEVISIKDTLRLDDWMSTHGLELRYQTQKNGGLHVAVEKVA
jgi:hypothetical protein